MQQTQENATGNNNECMLQQQRPQLLHNSDNIEYNMHRSIIQLKYQLQISKATGEQDTVHKCKCTTKLEWNREAMVLR